MHQRVLIERSVNAQNRITFALGTLCEIFDLDKGLVAALQPGGNDPAVRRMKEIEAVADALDAVATAAFYRLGVVTPGKPMASKQDDSDEIIDITPTGPMAPPENFAEWPQAVTVVKKTGKGKKAAS